MLSAQHLSRDNGARTNDCSTCYTKRCYTDLRQRNLTPARDSKPTSIILLLMKGYSNLFKI